MEKSAKVKRSNRKQMVRTGKKGSRSPDNLDVTQFRMPMTVTFPRNVIGFPDRLITVLKYSQQNLFGAGSPTPTAQVMALNSVFDPDNSGIGHQPSFFDSFAAIYGRYFVRKFQMTVEVNSTTSAIGILAVAVYADQDIRAKSTEELVEAKYSLHQYLTVATGGKGAVTIRLPWMTTMKLMGQPGTEADDNMYSAVTSSPTDVAWGIVKMSALDGTTNMTAWGRITIYFEVVFKDLLTQITS